MRHARRKEPRRGQVQDLEQHGECSKFWLETQTQCCKLYVQCIWTVLARVVVAVAEDVKASTCIAPVKSTCRKFRAAFFTLVLWRNAVRQNLRNLSALLLDSTYLCRPQDWRHVLVSSMSFRPSKHNDKQTETPMPNGKSVQLQKNCMRHDTRQRYPCRQRSTTRRNQPTTTRTPNT